MEPAFKIEILGEVLQVNRASRDNFPNAGLLLNDGPVDEYVCRSAVMLRQLAAGEEFEAEVVAFRQTDSKGILFSVRDRRLVFCHCLNGGLQLRRVDGENGAIRLEKECAVLTILPAGDYIVHLEEGTEMLFSFSMSATYFKKLARQYASVRRLYSIIATYGLYYPESPGKKTNRLINGIRSAAGSGRGDGFWLDARLWGFLHTVCSTGGLSLDRSGAKESVHRLKVYLDQVAEGPGRLPEVRELADYFHLHPKNLARVFRTEFGTTLRNYLLYLRMKAGYALLRDGRMSVNDVAYYLGYSNPFNFSRQFLYYFGFRPGELKKKVNKDDPNY